MSSPVFGERVKGKKPSLFNGFWLDSTGQKVRRVYRSEIAEAYRLWAVHKDIREGVVGAGILLNANQDGAIDLAAPSSPLRERHSWHERNPFHEELR
jgi:hypothetical protein